MSDVLPFEAIGGRSTRVNNSATASAQLILPASSTAVALTNNSTTAIAYYRITKYLDQSDPPIDSSTNAPTVLVDMPIQPSSQIRVLTGSEGSFKFIRLIASAADSYVTVTPGTGI